MKKIRLFSAYLLLISLIFLLTGCHGHKSAVQSVTPGDFSEDKAYQITFWAKNDTNINQVNVYKKAIRDFEALYPNIRVNMKLYTDYTKIYNDCITNLATGTTPNVCITYPDHIATYQTGENTVVPLEAFITDAHYGLGSDELKFDSPAAEEMVEQYLNEVKINGVTLALPFMRSTECCYVNKTYVEKLGFTLPEVLTWDFIWEVCDKATQKDANGNYTVNGQKTMLPFIYKSTDNMMIQYLKQVGQDISDEQGNIYLFHDKTEEFLLKLAHETASGAFTTFKLTGYPANFLNAGQCIFAVDSTAGSTWMGCHAPLLDISEDSLVSFETAVYPVPQVNEQNLQMISQGPSLCLFNKEDKGEVTASWLFMQYLLTDEVQIAYAQTEGYVPVTEKARQNPAYLQYLQQAGADNSLYYDVKIKACRILLDNTRNTFVTPVFNGSASLRNAAGQLIEEVVKAQKRNQPVTPESIRELYSSVTSLYRLDSVSAKNVAQKSFDTPLPTASKVFLYTLGGIWIVLIVYFAKIRLQKRNKS